MNINKEAVKFNIIKTIIYIVFFIMVIGVVYPLIWTFLNSLKGNQEFYINNFGFPKKILCGQTMLLHGNEE